MKVKCGRKGREEGARRTSCEGNSHLQPFRIVSELRKLAAKFNRSRMSLKAMGLHLAGNCSDSRLELIK